MNLLPGLDSLGRQIKRLFFAIVNCEWALITCGILFIATVLFGAFLLINKQQEAHRAQYTNYTVHINSIEAEVYGSVVGVAKIKETVYCTDMETGEDRVFINGKTDYYTKMRSYHTNNHYLVRIKTNENVIVKYDKISADAKWHKEE